MVEESEQREKKEKRQRPRGTLKSLAWGSVAVLGLGFLVALGVPLSSTFFPDEEAVSCTVTERPVTARGRRGGNIFPRVFSDCGTFRSPKQTVCTADPALDTPLTPGFTYDLTVRGANIPFFLSREIVSASVSTTQLAKPIEPLAALESDTGNDRLNEAIEEARNRPESRATDNKLAELEEHFSPENLRAFDYEQPDFNSSCDISRRVMTSIGLQTMSPSRATEMLTVPDGETARDPLLPCEGFLCNRPVTR